MLYNVKIVFASKKVLFFFDFKCASDANCITSNNDANVCVNGICVCGKSGSGGTGNKCTADTGKPKCTKNANPFTTTAETTDVDAVCSVS